ncbi:hypothetical protein [Floridanema evergladense]|uniref:Uncharacterized protein n=1 Tax=Floridaenema evergladense BLCC-F167 TaxID=3153639 RepID=A0ABV4WGM8_9CYAN
MIIDFLAVDLLIESFKAARDKDFRKAIETGKYGNNYQELIKNMNLLLLNKKINVSFNNNKDETEKKELILALLSLHEFV